SRCARPPLPGYVLGLDSLCRPRPLPPHLWDENSSGYAPVKLVGIKLSLITPIVPPVEAHMPQLAFSSPRFRLGVRAALFVVAAALLVEGVAPAQQGAAAKRPLKHTDYDSWMSIQAPVLSRDGKFLAYNLMPQEGDGAFVVRNIASGA